jgi:hypothetical protein
MTRRVYPVIDHDKIDRSVPQSHEALRFHPPNYIRWTLASRGYRYPAVVRESIRYRSTTGFPGVMYPCVDALALGAMKAESRQLGQHPPGSEIGAITIKPKLAGLTREKHDFYPRSRARNN